MDENDTFWHWAERMGMNFEIRYRCAEDMENTWFQESNVWQCVTFSIINNNSSVIWNLIKRHCQTKLLYLNKKVLLREKARGVPPAPYPVHGMSCAGGMGWGGGGVTCPGPGRGGGDSMGTG